MNQASFLEEGMPNRFKGAGLWVKLDLGRFSLYK